MGYQIIDIKVKNMGYQIIDIEVNFVVIGAHHCPGMTQRATEQYSRTG